jgi:2'-5' RNA ligase
MARYFIAIPLPDEAKDRLVAVQPPTMAGIRIIDRDEMHLTLHFLGEVSAYDVESACKTLANIEKNAFAIAFKGLGQFPPDGPATVLWAGVEVNADLVELHKMVGTGLAEAIGFRPEARAYTPHVTLARINQPAPPGFVVDYLTENQGFTVSAARIDRFSLYSSGFADNVPRYQEEAMFWLPD